MPPTMMISQPRIALALAFLLTSHPPTASGEPTGHAEIVRNTPGLVGFWNFGEPAGEPRRSEGTRESHPLEEVGGPIARIQGGPFSGYSAEFNGKQYLRIPYHETGDLNICGPTAQASMFAVVRLENLRQSRTIAEMWSEGRGAHDVSGTRQYALLMGRIIQLTGLAIALTS